MRRETNERTDMGGSFLENRNGFTKDHEETARFPTHLLSAAATAHSARSNRAEKCRKAAGCDTIRMPRIVALSAANSRNDSTT